jgi:hypothetical protein
MATVIHRWIGFGTDRRAVLFEQYADNSLHLVVTPEGASGQIPVGDCAEGLYDRHGTLVVSREPE